MANSSREVVLLTGGTGFLGWYLARLILARTERDVALLVRAPDEESARGRVEELLVRRLGPEGSSAYRSRVRAFPADVCETDLGLLERHAGFLAERTTMIIHSAAVTDFDKPYEEMRRANTCGTEHVLDFAERCRDHGLLESVAHISTVGVAGDFRGVFSERDLDLGQSFHNSYEKSKFEAEWLCLEHRRKGLNINVFRPSIIIGDSVTGFAGTFKVIYQPIQIFSLGLYSEIPADDAAEFNIVPVDAAAEAIFRILETSPSNGTFHITNSHAVTGGFVFEQASRFFGYPDPRRIPIDQFDLDRLRGFRRRLLEPYLPYFNLRGLRYDNSRSMEVLLPTGFRWPKVDEELLSVAFRYCLRTGFITPNSALTDERH